MSVAFSAAADPSKIALPLTMMSAPMRGDPADVVPGDAAVDPEEDRPARRLDEPSGLGSSRPSVAGMNA